MEFALLINKCMYILIMSKQLFVNRMLSKWFINHICVLMLRLTWQITKKMLHRATYHFISLFQRNLHKCVMTDKLYLHIQTNSTCCFFFTFVLFSVLRWRRIKQTEVQYVTFFDCAFVILFDWILLIKQNSYIWGIYTQVYIITRSIRKEVKYWFRHL